MNRQTKAYRKLGLATSNGGASVGTIKSFDPIAGRACLSDFRMKDKSNPPNKRKSPWKGCRKNAAAAKTLAFND